MFGNPVMLLSPYDIYQKYVYEEWILSVYSVIHSFFSRVVAFFKFFQHTPDSSLGVLPKTVVSLSDEYVEKHTHRFLKTFSRDNGIDYNSGVDAIFYNKKELTELLSDENNYLEKKWRTKLLFENTPRGNVIMFYDAYKQGFQYYSDQSSIPYPVLNAVSMKYVITFRCRDFFVDENILPENRRSGMIERHEEQSKAEKQAKAEKESPIESESAAGKLVPSKSSAFAKFKSYNTVSAKASGNTTMKSSEKRIENTLKESAAAPKLTNSLVSMGKMSNMSFIQKGVSKTPEFESVLLPKKKMSYADYKKLIDFSSND